MGFESDFSKLSKSMKAEVHEHIPKTAQYAFKIITLRILKDAIKRTPVDTGWLVGSAQVNFLGSNGYHTQSNISFNASYATLVHENPMGYSFNSGQSHFLSSQTDKHMNSMGREIEVLAKRFGGGVRGFHRAKRKYEEELSETINIVTSYRTSAKGQKTAEEISKTERNIAVGGGGIL